MVDVAGTLPACSQLAPGPKDSLIITTTRVERGWLTLSVEVRYVEGGDGVVGDSLKSENFGWCFHGETLFKFDLRYLGPSP